MLKADFKQKNNGGSWNNTEVDFSMKMGDGSTYTSAYDENGNIKAMWQKGLVINGPQVIDNMTYAYASLSNKLLNVSDAAAAYKLGDFTDGVNFTDDYSYDVNGNLVTDLNKEIYGSGFGVQPGIEYNHLNLPSFINMTGGGSESRTITYVYDAAGNKLEKFVSEAQGRGHSTETTTRYIAGLVYETKIIDGDAGNPASHSDVLQFAGQEEGRIRYTPLPGGAGGGFAYDYFIKDHLGNVRMVLTDEAQADQYPAATMEDATATAEETYYSNLNTTRVVSPTGYPANTPSGNAKVARVSGGTNPSDHKIGPAILLKVMSGDKFDVNVTSWYKTNGSSPSSPNTAGTTLLEALTSGVANLSNGKVTAGQLTTAGVFVSGISSFLTSQGTVSGKPKAYLNWILFDEQFNYLSASSGFEIVGSDNSASPYQHTHTNMPIAKNGFLYIYTSNETPNIDVFFDMLQVTHTRGQILEETHYYPFGLTMAGISSKAAGSMTNKEKTFQGQRFDVDFDLNWVQFKWRNHDPQIGRFTSVDPLADDYVYNSTYAFSENQVTSHIEMEGLEKVSIKGNINAANNDNHHKKNENVITLNRDPAMHSSTSSYDQKNVIPETAADLISFTQPQSQTKVSDLNLVERVSESVTTVNSKIEKNEEYGKVLVMTTSVTTTNVTLSADKISAINTVSTSTTSYMQVVSDNPNEKTITVNAIPVLTTTPAINITNTSLSPIVSENLSKLSNKLENKVVAATKENAIKVNNAMQAIQSTFLQ